MTGEPCIDCYDHESQLTSSHPKCTVDTTHPLGHGIQHRAELLGDQFACDNDVRYPDFESYVVAKPGTRTAHLPRNVPRYLCDLQDVVIAGKRQVFRKHPQNSFQQASYGDTEIRRFEDDANERSSFMEALELPADADHAGLLEEMDSISESHARYFYTPFVQDTSKRSSLLPDFGYLEPLIRSTSPVSDSAPQVEDANDLAYLGRWIIVHESSVPVSAPSLALPVENSSYLSKFIEVSQEHVAPQPRSPTSRVSSTPSFSSTQVSPTLSLASFSPIIPMRSPIATTATPAAAPPLSPWPRQYLHLQYLNVPTACTHEPYPSESLGTPQIRPFDYMEPSPPPLPPKPEPYRPRPCRDPVDYGASVEANYYRGGSQRLQARPE